ncbi:sulfurtransferase [Clostridioides difficile]
MKIKTNKKVAALLSMIMIASVVTGCSTKKEEPKKDASSQSQEVNKEEKVTTKDEYTYDNNKYFTSVSWLEKNMGNNKNIVIMDARSDKDYEKSHIPGAINVAWQSLAKMEGKAGDVDWGTLQDKDTLSATLSKLGITKDSQVVVYANKDGWGDDGRVVWCLQRAGIDARMLNGGIDLWTSEGKKTSKDSVEIKASDLKIDSIKPDMNITTEELKKEYKEVKIIDVRAKDEYEGAVKFGEARGGHLPDAINIPFNELYNEDGTIKTNAEIDKVMEKSGIKKTDKIVTYCTSGIRSAHMALVLSNAGYENVRNYDSSYYEWAADEANEVIK